MPTSAKTVTINHLPSRIISINDIEHLFFSGTSYLGMGHQSLFKSALLEGMNRYGTIFSASRNNNLQLEIYEQAENFIAQWTGAESALTVTSGLFAGQLTVQTLTQSNIIYAPSVHPALWREIPHFLFKNYDQFKTEISDTVSKYTTPVVISCNTIDPLKCQIYDFNWISELPDNQDITLVFDDSHAIGVVGTEGGGSFRMLQQYAKPNVKIIVIASLAKAVGIPGGVILSDKNTIQTIRKNPLFVGASPIIPAYLYAFLNAQQTYDDARKMLLNNIQLFEKLNSDRLLIFKYYQNYPVFHTEVNALFPFLLKHKILISSFSYPNPTDPPITRIIISALHTEGDIQYLSDCIKEY